MENYELSLDDTSAFSYHLNDCGYKNALSRNLILIGALMMIFLFFIVVCYFFDCSKKSKTNNKSGKQKSENYVIYEGGSKLNGNKAFRTTKCAWM